MDSGIVCGRAPVEPSSPPAAAKDGSASPSELTTLRTSRDFRRVLSTGRRVRRGAVTVVAAPSPEAGPRVGLVAGRGIGNAVRRNRAKRRIRHALREVSLEQGMDYVIIADRQVVEADFQDLIGWLRRAVEALR